MSRLIPQWVGNVSVPENRETTHQLLLCWAQLTDEVTNVIPLLRNIKGKMTEQAFIMQAQEVSMYLSEVLKDKKFPRKCNTNIYVGNPESATGIFNARVAGVLHRYFDEPTYKTRHPCVESKSEA